MDIERLLQSPALRRKEFPITSSRVFLAHAATSPLPARVSSAIQKYSRGSSARGQWEYLHASTERETRRSAAAMIGANEDEIAFMSSTSMGLSMVANGLSWRSGDNVVVADGDFPSNIYPWMDLRRRGVETRFIPRRMDGGVGLEDLEKTVDERTRLVSLSSVNFVTGFHIDVDSVGQYLHDRGVLFCVDGIQSLGAMRTDVRHVDFLASGSHKWIMGPLGVGFLYVRKDHFAEVHPALVGWKSVRGNKAYLDYRLEFQESAQRYEPSAATILAIVGLHAALGLLLETGVDRISARLGALRTIICDDLRLKGYELMSPANGPTASGITSFTADRIDIEQLRQDLDGAGYVVSLRDSLDGRKCIRIAPHFYNTEDEIRAFLDRVPFLT
ncbi:MAG: aminotransferase class V-fold PLP-dependent enzyme [Dehalococcoidia bacterium]|nr:aminotransferase class V-fold PLP-dependent enzyme [Dehalococcoidia bacterium]